MAARERSVIWAPIAIYTASSLYSEPIYTSFTSTTMDRRVHFASTSLAYSPIPATPSPTLSNSSLPSTSESELSTPPPQINYHPSPYPRSQLLIRADSPSNVEPKDMHIHAHLAYHPDFPPQLAYDVSLHPTTCYGQMPPQALDEAATEPVLSSLIITSPCLPPGSEIFVNRTTLPYVTVRDVLHSLYRGLRPSVPAEEYNGLPAPQRRDISDAFYTRIGKFTNPDEHREELSKGLKVVDYLGRSTRFMGLSGTVRGPDIWELNVS
ncbi:hypothetical protein BDQ12DRAFT_682318 [Crucibulum laeve]|uniref:DUF6699 domain-containing protein n=1 Tax=Crucibulum laeve TaxID=68775 RepID=A0A5C3M5R8_9AGAR|nr:hypothetical protein BDQ12DRAFT_682318 [Crucibulum laeve]